MKNYKRAQRRENLKNKVKKRVKLNGRYSDWMKHTSTPCSCWMCTDKYQRNQKQYVHKEILEQIELACGATE